MTRQPDHLARFDIDGTDAFDRFGVFLLEGSLAEVITPPALKPFPYNDWHEADGIDADLSAPRLSGRELTLRLASFDGFDTPQLLDHLEALVSALSDGQYHRFSFTGIGGRSYRLRLVSEPDRQLTQDLSIISLRLADDFPLDGYSYQPPRSNFFSRRPDLLDGRPLTDYGAVVTQGTLASFTASGELKQGLTRSLAHRNETIHDVNGDRHRKAREATLRLHLRASTFPELWNNLDALLFDLTRPEERTLTLSSPRQGVRRFRCAYKACRITAFYPAPQPWLDLDITMQGVLQKL